MGFASGFFAAAFLSAGIAAISGFGIGSLLTPLLAWKLGTKEAVAIAAVPHFAATVLRCWKTRNRIDWGVLKGFGLMSAAGGLAGALLHASLQSRGLSRVFGILLVFAGLAGLTGLNRRMRFRGGTAWLAGALSGLFGGLVGNQGGIRAAALMTFALDKEALVATSTAVGVAVDCARLPVYAWTGGGVLVAHWKWPALGSAGVVLGTVFGVALLRRIPDRLYSTLLSCLILALGALMLFRA